MTGEQRHESQFPNDGHRHVRVVADDSSRLRHNGQQTADNWQRRGRRYGKHGRGFGWRLGCRWFGWRHVDSDADSDAHTDANTDSDSDTDADTDTDSDSDSDSDSDTDSDANTDANANANANADTN